MWCGWYERFHYRVQDGHPVLHGDTLEHRQHGQPDVVEGGDARVGARPLLQADGDVGVTQICSPGGVTGVAQEAGGADVPLSHHLVWK